MINQPSNSIRTIDVYCGELCNSHQCGNGIVNLLHNEINGISPNITIGLSNFVSNPEKLPPRILDLLHISAYVFCADRFSDRGRRTSLNNSSWARSFNFHIPVLDLDFWTSSEVAMKMSKALKFMTGDRQYNFIFEKSNIQPIEIGNGQLSLFSHEYTTLEEAEITDVVLFSGGLDSLAGVIQHLNIYPDRRMCLVSHKSNKVTTHTQSILAQYLKEKYNQRLIQYGFTSHNKKILPSRDETQRTRMFLFASIAFAICHCYQKDEFFVYENGITSINLSKQTDVINARSSRTTHPKTIGLLIEFFRLFSASFTIKTPFYNMTKAEVLEIFTIYNEKNIITSSVSCSSTRNKPKMQSTHCGCCSQCIDRLFAAHASGLSEVDVIYANNILHNIPTQEAKQRVYNTLYLACVEVSKGERDFFKGHPEELMEVIEYWPEDNPDDSLSSIYSLFCRFGDSIIKAIKEIQFKYDDLTSSYSNDSLLKIVSQRHYLASPIQHRVRELDELLKRTLPKTFQTEYPSNENDLNDKIQGLLSVKGNYTREYPVLQFGITAYKADHAKDGIIIEAKYLRDSTTPSKATEGIAADIVKVPDEAAGILFIVYDPFRKINDDYQFISSFECKRENCYVRIYR